MTFRPPALRQLPPVVTHPIDGIWEVVIPIARTNLVSNPSFETGTTNWTAIGGSIARSTTRQYHGAYSLAITPTSATTDGARFDTVSLTSGLLYAYSAKVWAELNAPIKLALETTGGSELASVTARGLGRWQWIWGYYLESSTTTRRVTLRKNGGTDTRVIYLDGVQVEAIASGETVSTYLDGDQLGMVPNQQPPAYVWNGTPHASTSTRSGLTRSGGMVVRFKDYGFLLLAIVGLGLAPPQNVATEYARIDGGFDDYTRKPIRQFSLVGQFEARNYLELRALRGGLAQLLDRDENAQDQRLLLRYHLENSCGDVQSDVVALACKYVEGLGGQMDNHFAQASTITFTQYLPLLGSDNETGSALTVQSSLASADYFLKRTPGGVWSVPGGGSGGVTSMLQGLDGTIYLAGVFTNWNGNASSDGIVKYNPATGVYTPLSTGANGAVITMANLPDGKIVIGGSFTSAGGVANTARIAVYNPVTDAFTALGTGASTNNVYSLAVDSSGGIYAGGDYALMGGVANTVGIAYWNGSAWTALSTGANGIVYGLTIGLDNALYLTGTFTTLGGVSCNQIGKWASSAFTALSTGLNGSGGRALATGRNGLIYVGGLFTAAGGVSGTNRIANWNGTQFQAMQGGLGGDVTDLSIAPDGRILATGQFAAAGSGPGFPDGAALWNGALWTTIGIDTPAISGNINSGLIASDGSMYIAYTGTGTATVEAVTTLTNPGTGRSYPTITIKGPSSGTSRIYSIVNYTTGRAVYFSLAINAGETWRLVFQPDNLSFTSDFAGNIASAVLPGSNEADFFLSPGSNSLAFFSQSSTVTATIAWRPNYASLDDLP